MKDKKKALLVDIDGTLAHNDGHRGHFEWDKVGDDSYDPYIGDIVRTYADKVDIIIMSGRKKICMEDTKKWLRGFGVPYTNVFMRENDDNRPDEIVKEEMYKNFVEPKWDIHFVLDDRDKVVKMWRNLGLVCLQVREGNF